MVFAFDSKNLNQSLLAPISLNSDVGENLFYEPIYDQIKEARREEDPTLSQGVWQRDFKKSDWQLVESLCTEALSTKTKDLQIAGWLAEAWVVMNHLNGFFPGIKLIQSLSETFWEQIYPQITEEDKERRLHFYEWLDNSLNDRLTKIPLFTDTLNATHLSLSDWMHASRLEVLAKRVPDPQKVMKQAVQRNEMTRDRLQQALKSCSAEALETLSLSLVSALTLYEEFKKSLDDLLKDNSRPAMNLIPETLREMQKFVKAGLDLQPVVNKKMDNEVTEVGREEEEKEETEQERAVTAPGGSLTRSNAYRMVGEIASFLQTVDPHSPAPALLRRISTWENKSITDIFNDFGESPETWAAFAKILGTSQTPPKI